tara:strand:+ start:1650 stop:2105 length:456 start_codon:yes stop_codon:yes gene_type:complete
MRRYKDMGKRITEKELLSMDMDNPKDMAKLFARVLANTVSLGEEIDMLSTKLKTIGDMVMVLCMHSEDRTLTGKIMQLMMDNKEFVAYAERMANETSFEDMLEHMRNNPAMFNLPDDLSDEELVRFKEAYDKSKEMFVIQNMENNLNSEEE